ncbi:hypothetical protein [Serratia fonticola]|jgi:vacuolar-type H+-ATPase subunit H|uniref:hypothetical protein n=1 Tax=Serratia fonticola TaxID=47917 RepID=UPI0015C5E43E|nr:hypothetical protein [Serratia fonticola]NYA15737.1 hypothetical protein [Serratia fonticola]NYA35857.1 hypothetical protein [Serratia fonticola]
MNYNGFEGVRKDVAELSNEMYELNQKMRQLAQKYYWNSEELVERLAGQIINDAQGEMEKIYSKINELDHHFKD